VVLQAPFLVIMTAELSGGSRAMFHGVTVTAKANAAYSKAMADMEQRLSHFSELCRTLPSWLQEKKTTTMS